MQELQENTSATLSNGSNIAGAKPQFGLPAKLLIAFLIVALIPLMLILFLNVQSTRSSLETEAFKTLHASASHTALRLDGFINSNLDVVYTESLLPALADFLTLPDGKQNDPAARKRILRILKSFMRKNQVFISSYGLIDLSGHNVLDTDTRNIGQDLSGRSYFVQALETGLPVVSEVEFDQEGGEEYLYFSSPIQDGKGRPVGVLRARYSASILQQLIIRDTGLVGPRSFAMLINAHHLILANGIFSHGGAEKMVFTSVKPLSELQISELREKRLLPPEDRGRLVTNIPELEQGLNMVDRPDPHFTLSLPSTGDIQFAAAVTRMTNRPWLVTFFQPKEAFLAPAREQVRKALFVAILIAVLVSILALSWAHYLSRPIRRLTATAGRIAEGDLSAVGRVKTKDEIGILASTFNLMTIRLRHRIEMESLISAMSRKFINLGPEDMDRAVDEALETVGRFSGADRSFLFQVSPLDNNVMFNTNAWSRRDVGPAPAEFREFPARDHPVFMELLSTREQVHIHDTKDPDIADRVQYWRDRETRSFLCVSMVRGDRVLGFLGLESVKESRKWHHEDVHLLRMTGEIISSTLQRQKVERDKKHIEEQLRQSLKMEAVGTLAGGIAHDFNNLLQALSGNVQLLLAKKEREDPDRKYLEDISHVTERASSLVKRLLTFSRKMEGRLQEVDINEIVRNTLSLLERTIPKMIIIEKDLAPDVPEIFADPTQVEQILLNLASNAVDAMPDGGTIQIKTKRVDLKCAAEGHFSELSPGEYALLRISDTGVGMTADIQEHVFDPFFTTKEVGKGTGLGLSTVYGIVKSHKGYISCVTTPGKGTSFKIYLPASTSLKEVEKKQEAEPVIASMEGKETILLVDDEPMILDIAQEMLEEKGYNIYRAQSGEEALEVYKGSGEEIDLVIMDLGMPGMGGVKCIQKLREFDPKAKIVVASGYAAHPMAKKPEDFGAEDFIKKPYRLDNLVKTIRRVFDEKEK